MNSQNNNIVALKKKIRSELLNKRKNLNHDWVIQASYIIQQKVLNLNEFYKAQTVFCYISIDNEVDTNLIIKQCWKMNKKLYVPVFVSAINQYEAVIFTSDMNLVTGHKGIPEPSVNNETCDFIHLEEIDIAIVPGVAFDESCGRLGRGAGVYDKLLASYKIHVLKLGLAFEIQIIDKVPMGNMDVAMDVVVTEKRLIKAPIHKFRPFVEREV